MSAAAAANHSEDSVVRLTVKDMEEIRMGAMKKIVDFGLSQGAHVFGGYERDRLAGDMPNDIDLFFPFEKCLSRIVLQKMPQSEWRYYLGNDSINRFLDDVKLMGPVRHVPNSYEHNNCLTCRSEVEIPIMDTYHKPIIVGLDMTRPSECSPGLSDEDMAEFRARYTNAVVADMDVNMAERYMVNGKIVCGSKNPKCNYEEIVEHCRAKQFVVLDSTGAPVLKHTSSNCCIDRNTPQGKLIVERIAKMKARGWTCLNEPCTNKLCVSSR